MGDRSPLFCRITQILPRFMGARPGHSLAWTTPCLATGCQERVEERWFGYSDEYSLLKPIRC